MKKLAVLPLLIILAGCVGINHTRETIGPDGKVTGRETEKAYGVFSKAAVDSLSSTTKDGTYSHSFRTKGAQVSGDAETITATTSGLGTLIGKGIAAGLGKP